MSTRWRSLWVTLIVSLVILQGCVLQWASLPADVRRAIVYSAMRRRRVAPAAHAEVWVWQSEPSRA